MFLLIFHVLLTSGKFGSLLLSIPLRDGCEGKVTINYGSEQTTYNFESAGNKGNFVISAMAGTYHLNHVQDYTVESTSVMPVAFMVFHLIWTGSAELSNYMGSDELPCFLSSVTNAHQALSAWKTPPSVSREKPLELAPSFQLDQATNSLALDTSVPEQSACKKTEAENGAVKEVGLPFQTIATNVSDGIIVEPRYDSSELDQSKDEPLKEIIMANHALVCYPLTGCYTISKFSASSLKGEDVFTYHVFNSLSYVDVSLGVIVLLDHDDPDVNCCCCYADVIASTKCSRYHSLLLWDVEFKSFSKLTHLDVDKTVVGELGGSMNTDINTRSTLTPSFPASHCDAHQLRHSVPCVNAGKVPGKTFHPVVIIQPKWLVYPQHPKLHFNPALNSLQSRWQDAHRHFLSGDSTLRNHLVADIGRLVAFAFSPLAELVPNYCRVVFNVHYLLEHCLRFRAKDEGLLVLNFVAHKQCPCGMHDFNSELTTDSSLLLMIADFALQVAGNMFNEQFQTRVILTLCIVSRVASLFGNRSSIDKQSQAQQQLPRHGKTFNAASLRGRCCSNCGQDS